METRRERRQREKAERKASTKARLATPAAPPTVPVALPWRRTSAPHRLTRRSSPTGEVWSPVLSGDAMDLPGSLVVAASFVRALGGVLGGRKP